MKRGEYVELHARSAFSFLRGASSPDDLAAAAVSRGLSGIALCDRDGVYGVPRLHGEMKELKGPPVWTGAELTMEDGSALPVLVATKTGYRNLCRLLTKAKLRGTKKQSAVRWNELPEFAEGLIALTGDEEGAVTQRIDAEDFAGARAIAAHLVKCFGAENVAVELQRHLVRGEEARIDALADLAADLRLPTVATNGVLYAEREQREVLDVFTCARHHTHLDAAGRLLARNGERNLKSLAEMRRLFADRPEAVEQTRRIAERLEFSIANPGYEFPRYQELSDEAMAALLRNQAYAGARRRYGKIRPKVRRLLDKELGLIGELGFSGYFLIVWDIVRHCESRGILVQGRGSAANSLVCFCLGITACDPLRYQLLFERFLAPKLPGQENPSWPDIDLDLPSGDRRESVIQEVYQRYGEHGAAMTANVITYRGKSAMREIGKALNFPPESLDRFSKLYANGDFPHTLEFHEQMQQAGLPPENPRVRAVGRLYDRMCGLPRHLGQHSGGMIICQNALSDIVPLERASMPGRVVVQWDKNDCDDLGIIKVDLLGLGMMAVMQDAFTLCQQRHGERLNFYNIRNRDRKSYALMQDADTIGLFQIESRAQMATLPRLRPENFYDIAVQIAIIRPGPIEGGMVNPYLARRMKREPVDYFGIPEADAPQEMKTLLGRTLGVPLFQEQLLAIAMKLAGFDGREVAELKKALSFHRSHKKMVRVCGKLRSAMAERGVDPGVAERILKSVQAFAVYGFPESHALSFAYIAYASAYLKAHRPAEFYAALLNNQPMGFYSPSTLIYDARARGVRVRPVSVVDSDESCVVESNRTIRLGLNTVRGLSADERRRIVAERARGPFASVEDFKARVRVDRDAARTLARIGALNDLGTHRREGLWRIEAPARQGDLFERVAAVEPGPLEVMDAFERMRADYAGTGVTTGSHPMGLLRETMPHAWRAADLREAANGARVCIAGMVICRQRPGTARGFVFISLEDETGVANAVVTPALFEARRLTITQERFLEIRGVVQNVDRVIHVRAERIEAMRAPVAATPESHDFH